MGKVDCLCNRVEPFAALFWALNNVCYLSTYVCPTPTLLYSTHWLEIKPFEGIMGSEIINDQTNHGFGNHC